MLLFQSIKELEDEMLNGQKLQGPFTADEVNYMLKNKVTGAPLLCYTTTTSSNWDWCYPCSFPCE